MANDKDLLSPPSLTGADHTTAWGIGSILLGMILPFAVPLGSLAAALGFTAYSLQNGRLSPEDIRELIAIIQLILLVIAPVPLLGLFFGIRGLIWAGRTRTPWALPLTGLLICILNLVALGVTLFVVRLVRVALLGS
jgi:hypothetical protein